jgi:signal transduction histidine kinase/ligand-binding sensor domain-containing protein/CheY-like chemotaxis protein
MRVNLHFVFSFILLYGTLAAGFAQTQDLNFDHLSVEQGLSQGNVWDIYQDGFGFIWIATEDGLNMYDGYSFTVFRNNPADDFSISNNNIRCIAEDANGDLWMGTRGGLNRYTRESGSFDRFISNEAIKGSISNDVVECIIFDSKGRLWVGTDNGLNLYNPESKTFKRFFHQLNDGRSLADNSVRAILEDSKKQIWVGTSDGLSLLNSDENTFTNFYHHSEDPSSLSSNTITALIEDKNQTLWVGTFDRGLNKKHSSKNEFIHFTHNESNPKSLSNNYIYGLTEDKAGNLWAATDRALDRMVGNDGTFVRYEHKQEDENSLRGTSVTNVFFDVNDRMWVGTRFGGINVYDKNKYGFQHYRYRSFDKKGLNHNTISIFKEEKDGNFWIATDGGGLNYFDRKSNTFTAYLNTFTNNKILALEKDEKGGLWIGMWQGGVNYFDPVTKKVKHYLHDPANPKSLSDNNIFYILKDRKENIWIATWGNGLSKYNPETDDFTHYLHDPANPNSIGSSGVAVLMEDSNGNLWIGTELSGVDMLDPESNTFVHYQTGPEKGSLNNNFITALFEDSKKRIWVGTYGGGLNLFDPKTKTFKAFRQGDGLPNDAVMGIQEDADHKLWISTNSGLSHFDPENLSFKNFTKNDGLQGNQFTRWASARLSTGEMLFGGTNGFNLFHPDDIKANPFKPPVYITGFKISNKPVKVGKNEILKRNIILNPEIQIDDHENVFSFEFTALNYLQPEKNQYRYKMDGFQEEWIEAGTERKASYTNLNPGRYVFRVMGSNNDGIWNEKGAAIEIIINPPYWATLWFRTIAALIIIGSVYSLFRIRVNAIKRQKVKLEEQVRQQTAEVVAQKEILQGQAEHLQTLNSQLQAQTDFLETVNDELEQQKDEIIRQREKAEKAREEAEQARQEAERANQAKSIFLATMSHEIRTPMNGVLGMTSLLAETAQSAEQQEYTETIRTSGDALLTVINDILDFSKIESGSLELDYHGFDMRQCLEEVMDVFSTKAAEKGLDLVYQIDYKIPAQIVGDGHRLRQILINLVSNAMKFTQQGEIFVEIELQGTEKDQLHLAFHVRDTGIGIPQDKISRLFKAFSQVDSSTTRKYGGTGLGLIISQRLVELMGGVITVESQEGVGTTFSFTINTTISQEPIRQYAHFNTVGNEGKRVLLVDDNMTNLTILKTQLEQWNLSPTLASAGQQALEILALPEERFDLVITDMQMPDMDGTQLSQHIKAKHAHLPIILLSSVGDESKKKYPELFAAVLNKPAKQQQLSRVIQLALRPEGTVIIAEAQKSKQILSEEFAEKYPLRILIAEDNPVNQKLAIRVLNKLGYKKIDIAQNGREALEKFAQEFYEVILMDVQMPDMDGLEATRQIRENKNEHTVIIAMTANAMQGDREECIRAGMDDYIGKPIKFETLMSLLEKWSMKIKSNVYGRT